MVAPEIEGSTFRVAVNDWIWRTNPRSWVHSSPRHQLSIPAVRMSAERPERAPSCLNQVIECRGEAEVELGHSDVIQAPKRSPEHATCPQRRRLICPILNPFMAGGL